MTLEFFCATDVGRARDNNEDSVALDESVSLAVLADGMGGYNAGEVASQMLTSFIRSELGRWLKESGAGASAGDVRRAMDICVDNANRAIFNAANTNPRYPRGTRPWCWACSARRACYWAMSAIRAATACVAAS
eukprot:Opistho-2@51420